MILGLSCPLQHNSPQEWAMKHRALGCKAVVFPVDCNADSKLIAEYKDAAVNEDLTIAEVGIWKNVLAADKEERLDAVNYAVRQLRLADHIGAKCCVNITGTPHGPRWDGGYADNYSTETWKLIVESIQSIIDTVQPKHTKLVIETMPWMVPSDPDEYLRLIEAVDRDALGVHLDIVNMINCPKRYFFAQEFMLECFDKLKGRICSCHLKDVLLLEEYTFKLRESACGKGTMPLEDYARLASTEDPQMPMIIEHLHSDEEYVESLHYVMQRLSNYLV